MLTDELRLNEKDKEYKKKIDTFGKETIKKVEIKSKMFGSTVNQITNSVEYSNDIEKNINNLNTIVANLDPSNIEFSTKKGLFFNSTKKYLKKIKSKESTIKLLVENLKKEREILKRDNITLEIEIKKLEDIISQIEIEYQNGIQLKKDVTNDFKKIQNKGIEEYYIQNIIDPLDKKLLDLREMAIVKNQSRLALEIICKNNRDIIRNLEKIQNVTMEALNTAIMTANSLNNQKAVLNKTKKSDTFDNFYQAINEIEIQNKTKIPEIKNRITELKKIEDI